MDWKIEVVVIPVSDLDRAKQFYADQCGFVVDLDHQATESIRFVQMTPPGSGCSIQIGTGVTDAEPGSVRGIQMTVDDIDEARAHAARARRRGWARAALQRRGVVGR